ncbi:MAG: response regulator [Elusimicrobia bacterium]|nr:response regulator [Elusimicrobiota bacterium]
MKKRILVVDDDVPTLEYLDFLFTTYGYTVKVASSGELALKSLELELPDLVFLDLMMPKLSGYEVCCQIRANPRTANVPIVLYTATTIVPDDITKGIEIGADEFLTKPFNLSELEALLLKLFARQSNEMGYNPLTKLPGNIFIEKELKNRSNNNINFAFCYLNIDNFKAYNNFYGFKDGDKVILFAANILKEAINELGSRSDFIGHIGGDNFIFITTTDKVDIICERVTKKFDELILKHYDEEDIKRGYMIARDKDSNLKEFSFMAASISVLTNEKQPFPSLPLIIETLISLKLKAKKNPNKPKGSYISKF